MYVLQKREVPLNVPAKARGVTWLSVCLLNLTRELHPKTQVRESAWMTHSKLTVSSTRYVAATCTAIAVGSCLVDAVPVKIADDAAVELAAKHSLTPVP